MINMLRCRDRGMTSIKETDTNEGREVSHSLSTFILTTELLGSPCLCVPSAGIIGSNQNCIFFFKCGCGDLNLGPNA